MVDSWKLRDDQLYMREQIEARLSSIDRQRRKLDDRPEPKVYYPDVEAKRNRKYRDLYEREEELRKRLKELNE
jgi:hypothetical protein